MRRAASALATTVVLCGCGVTAANQPQASGGRTQAPAGVPRPAAVSPQVRAEEEAIHKQVIAALHAPPSGPVGRGIPAYLRLAKARAKVGRIVSAQPTHPATGIEGDLIWLDLASGRTLATVVGPAVPARVQGTAVRQTATEFRVTFAHTRGSIPLAQRDFTIVDEFGAVHVPAITTVSGALMPARAPVGRPLTLLMRSLLPVGAGALAYKPSTSARKPIARWEFDVETD